MREGRVSCGRGLSGGSGAGSGGLFRVPVPSTNQRITAGPCCVAQILVALHNHFGHCIYMVTYRRSEEDERRILRCAACDGTVFGEIAGFVRADANTACASCGMTLLDSPFSGGDYFDVIMRVGRPMGRGARFHRAG